MIIHCLLEFLLLSVVRAEPNTTGFLRSAPVVDPIVAIKVQSLTGWSELQQEIKQMGLRKDEGVEVPLRVLSQMSLDVYSFFDEDEPNPRPPTGWRVTHVSPTQRLAKGNTAWAVYDSSAANIAVIAFKGTTFTNVADLWKDLTSVGLGFGPLTAMRNAARNVKQLQEAGRRVMVTGHSLGGYLAEVASTNIGLEGIGFCAPGPGSANGGFEMKGFRHVNFVTDPLGNLFTDLPGWWHKQWGVYVEDYGQLPSFGNIHVITSMHAAMLRRFDWTNQNLIGKCESGWTGYFTYRFPSSPVSLSYCVKVSDENLYMHVWGGSKEGNQLKLHGTRDYAAENANSQFTVEDIGSGRSIIKVSDQDLYLHVWGGSKDGNNLKLHGDRKYALQHANSQFIIESIGMGQSIVKISDNDLYLHVWGGSKDGNQLRLHGDRYYAMKHSNSHFRFLKFPFVESKSIVKVSDQDLHLHVWGGSKDGNQLKLHGNREYAEKHSNSQFLIEDIGDDKFIVKVSDQNLYLHVWGGSRDGNDLKLHGDRKYALQHANSQFAIESIGNGQSIVKVSDQELYLHVWGGSRDGNQLKLHGNREYAKKHSNSHFKMLDAPYFLPKSIVKVSDQDLYIHVWGGSKDGNQLKLHGNREYAEKHSNSQFLIEDIGDGKFIIKVSDQSLFLHVWGGSKDGNDLKLHGDRKYALQHANSQFMMEDVQDIWGDSRFIVKVSDQDLYLHVWGGSKDGNQLKLHGNREYALKHANSHFQSLHVMNSP